MFCDVNEVFVYESYTSSQVLALLSRAFTLYIDNDVFLAMPRLQKGTVGLEFFQEPQAVASERLEGLMVERERVLVDAYALIAWNLAHPEYSVLCPNGTQWRNASGDFCYVAFWAHEGNRNIAIAENPGLWQPKWTFALYGGR